MACLLTWSPSARFDLHEIFAYISENNPVAASIYSQPFYAVESLPAFPESDRIVPEFGDPTIREINRRPCRIVCRVKAGSGRIEIVRVWHAARGIPKQACSH